MELIGVVSLSLDVSPHDGLYSFSFYIRPRKATRIEKNVLDVASQNIAVPDAEMEHLMSA